MKKNFKKILGVVLAASMAMSTSVYADETTNVSSDSLDVFEVPAEDISNETDCESDEISNETEELDEISNETEDSAEDSISNEQIIDNDDSSVSFEIEENEYISEEDALNIAINDAGLDFYNIVIEKSEFKDKDGNPVYEFKITSDNAKYTYVINALDGSISYSDVYYIENNTADITEETALDIAINDAGIDVSSATVESFTLNKGNSIFGYKFLINVDNTIYEYIINAADGSVVKKNSYRKRGSQNNTTESTTKTIAEETTEITSEEITESITENSTETTTDDNINDNTTVNNEKKPDKDKTKDKKDKENKKESADCLSETVVLDIVASDAAIDISTDEIEKLKLDEKDNSFYYEIKIQTDNAKYEYTINAIDGTIVDREIDEKIPAENKHNQKNTIEESTEITSEEITESITENSTETTTDDNINDNTTVNNETVDEKKSDKDKTKDKKDKENKKESADCLSETVVLDIVTSDAAIDISTDEIEKLKLDEKDNSFYYEIKIQTDNTKYEYTINAIDGTIVDREVDEKNPNNENKHSKKDKIKDIIEESSETTTEESSETTTEESSETTTEESSETTTENNSKNNTINNKSVNDKKSAKHINKDSKNNTKESAKHLSKNTVADAAASDTDLDFSTSNTRRFKLSDIDNILAILLKIKQSIHI